MIEADYELHDRKNRNYASDEAPLSNLKSSERIGVPGSVGTFLRMMDKWQRLENLMSGVKDEVGESIKDTVQDLRVYLYLFEMLLDEEKETA